MVDDAALEQMLRKLAAMPPVRREAVIGALAQAERETLRLKLNQAGGCMPSDRLAKLIDRVRAGAADLAITPRAAQALLVAADESAGPVAIDEALERLVEARPARRGFFARMIGA